MFPSDQQLSGLVSFLLRLILYALQVQLLQDPVFLGGHWWALQRLLLGGQQWHLVGWSDLTNIYFGGNYNGVGTHVPQAYWHLAGAWI